MAIESVVETTIGVLVGGGLGTFITYTLIKLNYLSHQVNIMKEIYEEIPTPEEIAKQALRTKLPISDLPDDLKQELAKSAKSQNMFGKQGYEQEQQPQSKPFGPEYVG